MKVLVTGANGYLGKGIVAHLLDNGFNVIATDFNVDNIDARAVRVASDLFSINNPVDYFENPDIILHLAWQDGFVHDSPKHIEYLYNHYAFIKSFSDAGTKTIAVMGTMHEIGPYEGCIDETTKCDPVNPYGIAKNCLRNLTRYICEKNGNNFLWLRGFYIVNNDSSGNSIFSKICQAEKQGESYFPFTSGLNKYDFIDYDQFCEMVSLAITQSRVQGIINICSGTPISLKERVTQFIKENDFHIKLMYGAYPDRSYDSKEVWGDNKLIQKIIKNRKEGSYE